MSWPGSTGAASVTLEAEETLWRSGLAGRIQAAVPGVSAVPGREIGGAMHWRTVWLWGADDGAWDAALRFGAGEMADAGRETAPLCLQRLTADGETLAIVVLRTRGARVLPVLTRRRRTPAVPRGAAVAPDVVSLDAYRRARSA